jgi:hypothetical protein
MCSDTDDMLAIVNLMKVNALGLALKQLRLQGQYYYAGSGGGACRKSLLVRWSLTKTANLRRCSLLSPGITIRWIISEKTYFAITSIIKCGADIKHDSKNSYFELPTCFFLMRPWFIQSLKFDNRSNSLGGKFINIYIYIYIYTWVSTCWAKASRVEDCVEAVASET